ncbi:MAG: hypothetical protein ACSHX8_11050 [Opitutaceae bacterium]
MILLVRVIVTALALVSSASGVFASPLVDTYISPETTLAHSKSLLSKLKAPLSIKEEQQCLAFLKYDFSEEAVAHGRVRQNDLADWMLQRSAHVEPTTQAIIEIIGDESIDLLWREFCVQKLALAASQKQLSEHVRLQCYHTLERMAADARIAFSGTSLLGLYRLYLSDSENLSKNKILALSEHVLKHSEYSTANKVTALQVAGFLGSQLAIDYARNVINSDESIQIRVSAIALLSRCGNFHDLETIRHFTDSLDYRLRQSSKAAVTTLENYLIH